MCESFINPNRKCAVTRGCATADQCMPGGSTVLDNEIITVSKFFCNYLSCNTDK